MAGNIRAKRRGHWLGRPAETGQNTNEGSARRRGDHAEVELFVRILNDRNGEVFASTCFTASASRAAAIRPISALVSAARSLDLWNVERRIDPAAICSLRLRPCKIRLRRPLRRWPRTSPATATDQIDLSIRPRDDRHQQPGG